MNKILATLFLCLYVMQGCALGNKPPEFVNSKNLIVKEGKNHYLALTQEIDRIKIYEVHGIDAKPRKIKQVIDFDSFDFLYKSHQSSDVDVDNMPKYAGYFKDINYIYLTGKENNEYVIKIIGEADNYKFLYGLNVIANGKLYCGKYDPLDGLNLSTMAIVNVMKWYSEGYFTYYLDDVNAFTCSEKIDLVELAKTSELHKQFQKIQQYNQNKLRNSSTVDEPDLTGCDKIKRSDFDSFICSPSHLRQK